MSVEVAHAVPVRVFQQHHQIEGVTDPFRAEAQVLVELADPLSVEVDVEELSGPEGLSDAMVEGKAGHRLVGELGVESDHLRILELIDEGERMADGRQKEVTPWLVWLGLECEAQVVSAVANVDAEDIDRLRIAVKGRTYVLGGIALDAFASTPHHVDAGAQLNTKVDGVKGLGYGVAANGGIVGGEGAVLEDGMGEEVGGGHRHLHPRLFQGATEALNDGPAFCGRGAGRHEVVVVEVDAVGTERGEAVHGLDRIEGRPHLGPERIAAAVAHGPETEGEAVLRRWRVRVSHGYLRR